MRNFKSYLTEQSTLTAPLLMLELDFNEKHARQIQYSDDRVEEFEIPIKEEFGQSAYIDFSTPGDNLKVYIHPNTNNINEAYLTSVWSKVQDLFEEYTQGGIHEIINEEITFRAEISDNLICVCEKVNIDFRKPGTLHNIHKHIPNCRILYILTPDKISGSVLGILKIKQLRSLKKSLASFNRNSKYNMGWIKIVSDHLMNKDILACHEELVDNGLEEYAQL